MEGAEIDRRKTAFNSATVISGSRKLVVAESPAECTQLSALDPSDLQTKRFNLFRDGLGITVAASENSIWGCIIVCAGYATFVGGFLVRTRPD